MDFGIRQKGDKFFITSMKNSYESFSILSVNIKIKNETNLGEK